MKSKSFPMFSIARTAILATLTATSLASATTFTWDADGVDPLNDGGGNWNATGGTNWWNGSTYGAWGNTTSDEAIFGVASGAASTITVGTVNANKLTFNAPGSGNYLLSGGTITLGGSGPTITANVNARIDSTITSTSANAFIRGAGTLTLGGTSTFTGGQPWEGLYRYVPGGSITGTLEVVSGANITAKNFSMMQDGSGAKDSSQFYNQTGGTFIVSGEFGLGGATTGGTSGNTNTASISGGTLSVGTSLNLYKWATSNLNVSNSGTVNAASIRLGWSDATGYGTINVGDGTNFSGGTSIQDGGTSGVLNVNSWNIQTYRSYTLNFKGGTLKAGAAGTNWLAANAFSTTAGANVQEAGGIIDNDVYAITIAQVLKHGGVAATDGGLVFKGSSTTTLTGVNTYTGGTKVDGGILEISEAGSLGSGSYGGAITLATGTTLRYASSAAQTLSGAISGAGTLNKTGTGNLTISTLAAGTNLVLDAGTTYCNNGSGIAGNLQINTGATFSNTTAHVFARPSARIWINGGTLGHGPAGYPEYYLPQGTSAIDAGVRMTGGTLAGGGDNRYDHTGTAYITTDATTTTALISGNMMTYQGGTQIYTVGAGTVTGGSYVGMDLEVTGSLGTNFGGGTTNITKNGAGVMEISGTPTLNGSGLFTLNEGTLRLTGTNAVTNFGGSGVALHATNAATLQLNAAAALDSLTFSKNITGGSAAATVSKIGLGAVTFSTAKTYLGATQVNAGTLILQGNLNTASAITVANNSTLTANTNNVSVGSITINAGGMLGTGTASKTLTATSLIFDGNASLKPFLSSGSTPINVTDLTVNGGASSISLAPSGSGLVNGTTYNLLTYTGTTNIADISAYSTGSRIYTPSFDVGTKTIKILYDATSYPIWTGALGTDWSLATQANPKNWKLSTDSSATDFMNLDLVLFDDSVGAGSTTVNIAGSNVNTTSVTFNNTTKNYTLQSTGSFGIDTGTIIKNNAGDLSITNINSTIGAVALNGGTTSISQSGGLGTGTLTFNGGALNYTGATASWSRSIVIDAGGGNVAVDSSGTTFTVSSSISGAGTLTKSGVGTLALDVANTYGGTVVSQGTLTLGNVNAAGTNGAITLGDANTGNNNVVLNAAVYGGTFTNPITVSAANTGTGTVTIQQSQNYSNLSGLLTLNRPTTLSTSAGDRASISGKITGNVGTLTFSGSRTTMEQTIGNASDFTGNVVIASGTLQLNADSYGIPSTASVTVNNSATFRPILGDGKTQGIDALNGAGTVHNDAGRPGGDPTWTVTLSVGNSNSSGNFSGVLRDGATKDILALTKEGSGTQTLSGTNNTYTGATTINAGTLLVSGSIGSSAVTVSNSGTVLASGATGSIGSTVTVNNGAILAAGGKDAIGTATVTNGSTLNSGSIFSWDIDSGAAQTAGIGYDSVKTSALTGADAAIFNIVLKAGDTFASTFWDSQRDWTNIFSTDGTSGTALDMDSIFTSFTYRVNGEDVLAPTGEGSFGFTNSGKTLTWSAVPEPTSALAGLLLGAGLLRRRRRGA